MGRMLKVAGAAVSLAVAATVLVCVAAPEVAVAVGSSDYRAKIMSFGDDLQHYWRLGDSPAVFGASADEVVGGSGMFRASGSTTFGEAGIFSGDSAAAFSTVAGYRGMKAGVNLDAVTSASVDLWAKPGSLPAAPDGVPGVAVLFDSRDADNGYGYKSGLALEVDSDGYVTGRAGFDQPGPEPVPVASVKSTSMLSVGAWSHVTLTYTQDGMLKIYVDGGWEATSYWADRDLFWEWGGATGVGSGHRVGNPELSIGVSANNLMANPFDGTIDEVSVVGGDSPDDALDAGEVADIDGAAGPGPGSADGTIRRRLTRPAAGDPVDVASGNMFDTVADLPVPDGVTPLAALDRHLNTLGYRGGQTGPAWTTSFDTHIERAAGEDRVLFQADGEDLRFAVNGTNTWSSPASYLSALTFDTATNRYSLARPDGSTDWFNQAGLLVERADSVGRTVVLMRSSGGFLSTVTAGSYTLTFADTTMVNASGAVVAGSDGLADKVSSTGGRVVRYAYKQDPESKQTVLTTASYPHSLAEDAASSRSYGQRRYTTQNAWVKAIYEESDPGIERLVAGNTFDAQGRITEQISEDGDKARFHYGEKPGNFGGGYNGLLGPAPGFTTVDHEASQDRTVYAYSSTGQLTATYDAFGKPLQRTWTDEKPASTDDRTDGGVDTQASYDAAGRPTTVTETVGSVTRTTASYTYLTAAGSAGAAQDQRLAASTDSSGVVTEFGYSPSSAAQPTSISVVCPSTSTVGCPGSGKSTSTIVYDTAFPDLVARQTDPDGVKTEYTYWPDRSVKEVKTFPEGAAASVTSYGYSYPGIGSGEAAEVAKIVTVTAPGTGASRVTVTRYDAEGRVLEVRDPQWNGTTYKATRYQYFADGSLKSVTDPADHTTTYRTLRRSPGGAWPSGAPAGAPTTAVRLDESQDPDGISDWTFYDRSGDAIEEWHGKAVAPSEIAKTKHTFGGLARLTSTVDPMGVMTSYHYDVEGRVTGVTTGADPEDASHTVTTEYDAWGQVLSETTPMGTDPDGTAVQRKVSSTYDSAGRKTSQLEGAGGPAGEQFLTGYVYDAAGRVWRTVEHRHAYTDTANPTTLHTADRVIETRYTPGGRTAQTLAPPVDVTTFDWSGADSTKAVTTYGYDGAGRQLTVEGPDGGVTETAYGADGQVASVMTPGGHETSFTYDAAGRRIGVVTPSGLTGSGDPATVTAVTAYDAAGRVTSVSDPHIPVSGVTDASTRLTAYTAGGRVDSVTDANGNTVTYGYDSRGNRTSRTALDDAAASVVESWTWNLADQELTHTVPAPVIAGTAKTTTRTYNAAFGWLATVADPTSRVQTYGYYNDGTLEQTTHTKTGAATAVDKFWVNGRGWRTKATTTRNGPTPTATTWAYDRVGQVLTEAAPTGAVTHTYGLAGEKLTLGYPDGTTGSYLHDPAGRLTEVSVTSSGVTVPYASYSYDDDGRQTSELIHAAGGAVRTSTYDDAGRLATLTEVLPNATSTWETYTAALTYRPDGRLETETVNSDPTVSYGYDDAGQLTSAVDGVRDRSWAYGTRGNRVSSVDGGVATTYITNPNGSMAQATTGSKVVYYRYDDAGRRWYTSQRTSGAVTSQTLNGFTTAGQATDIQRIDTGGAATEETRVYDADGRVTYAYIGEAGATPKARDYLWDTTTAVPQIIEHRNHGALWFRSTWGNQRIGFKNGTAAPQWFQYDARGSVIRTDPANTDVVNGPEAYTAFGEAEGFTGYDRFGYRGELTNSDRINLRARDYDPETGQFTSQDPLDGVDGTPGVANPYQYADGDPLNRVDPSGLRPDDCGYGEAALCDRTASVAWEYYKKQERILRSKAKGPALCTLLCGVLGSIVVANGDLWYYLEQESRDGHSLDAKPAMRRYQKGHPEDSILPPTTRPYFERNLADVGDPDYLVYYDMIGNIMWGRLINIFLGFIPDNQVVRLQEILPSSGTTEPGDNVMVRAGLRLGKDDSLADVLAAIRQHIPEVAEKADGPLVPKRSGRNKLVPWGYYR